MSIISIGIDPGIYNGIAIYNDGTKKLDLHTEDFWETIKCIIELRKYCHQVKHEFKIYIECPYLNKGVFRSRLANSKSPNMDLHIAEKIGSNKQVAKLLVEFCKNRNIYFQEIRPTKKKKDSKEFFEITGIKKSSQHARDATMILINLNVINKFL